MNIRLLIFFAVACTHLLGTGTIMAQDSTSCTTLELVKTDVTCFGAADGTISLNIVGDGTYSFLWSNGATTQNIESLDAGSYSVLITSEHGEQQELSSTIVEPEILSISKSVSMVSCQGQSDGSIELMVSGGKSPYSYNWSNGATSSGISNLAGGDYSVTVTDANGCSKPASYTVLEPQSLLAEVSTNDCNDGNLNLTVSGGVPPYSYLWSTGETTQDIKVSAIGTYDVTVTDAKGCSTSQTVNVDALEVFELTAVTTKPTCWGGSDGAIDLTINGGVAPFTYLWSNGATTQDLTDVASGSYSVTVTDARGCSKEFINFLANPTAIFISAKATSPTCGGSGNDGTVDVNIFNAAEPYTVSWSNGSTEEDINNLAPGSYTITVTDANGCQNSRTFNIEEPVPPQLDLSQAYCGDGQICPTITGGSGSYNYLWSDGSVTSCIEVTEAGTYSLTVTDENGCESTASITIDAPNPALTVDLVVTEITCNNLGAADLTVSGGSGSYTVTWNTGATTEDLTNLGAGTYDVTVEDANGCTQRKVFSLKEPESIQIAANTVTNTTCSTEIDGAIDISISNGLSPYTYSWSNGATSEDLGGIGVGSYTVTVTDANGCNATMSFEVIADPSNSSNCPNDNGGSTDSGDGSTVDESGDTNPSVSFCSTTDTVADDTSDDTVVKDETSTDEDWEDSDVPTAEKDCEGYKTVIIGADENPDTGCVTYTYEVSHKGNLKYGLSHYTVGIPCGKVSNASNTWGAPMEFDLVDPTTDLYGFKINNTNGFGGVNTPQSFQVTYTLCPSDDNCEIGLEDWSPVVAYKAGECVDYDTLSHDGFDAGATYNHSQTGNEQESSGENQEKSKAGPQNDTKLTFMKFQVYPNPYNSRIGQKLKVDFSHVNVGQEVHIEIRDITGNSLYTQSMIIQEKGEKIELQIDNLETGIYFVTVSGLYKVYAKKLIVK